MARWAIIDKETGVVLNAIEADVEFIEQLKQQEFILVEKDVVKRPEEVEIIESEIASKDDIVINGKVYRYAGGI
ncbi:MAG: hypothetical protein QXR17_06940 [Candidatus Bathyarchaeia archaeon]